MRPFLMAGLMMVMAFGGARAQDIVNGTAASSPAHRNVLNAARAKAQQQLGKRVRFDIKQCQVVGDWAFLHAGMLDPNGQPISYAGTRFEDADRRGQKSSNYDALLKHADGHWTVRVDSVGATDVPWTNWSHDYGAPAKLFDDTVH
ncbi:MAG TPA: hypothetical protein VGV14_00470 [Rhodanobacter sp.]|nr:hypothetical protein [Rhodanobacter sp.]